MYRDCLTARIDLVYSVIRSNVHRQSIYSLYCFLVSLLYIGSNQRFNLCSRLTRVLTSLTRERERERFVSPQVSLEFTKWNNRKHERQWVKSVHWNHLFSDVSRKCSLNNELTHFTVGETLRVHSFSSTTFSPLCSSWLQLFMSLREQWHVNIIAPVSEEECLWKHRNYSRTRLHVNCVLLAKLKDVKSLWGKERKQWPHLKRRVRESS